MRLLDSLRQLHAHLGHRIAHVRDGAIDRRADLELDDVLARPSIAQEVMLWMLPMPATAALDLLQDLRLDLLRRRAGLRDLTCTNGKAMSGLSVIGRRTNATMPMNNSTTNSTIGDTGCRIAQAEMFLHERAPAAAACASCGDLHVLAVAQESAGGGHDPLGTGQTRAMMMPVGTVPPTCTSRRST